MKSGTVRTSTVLALGMVVLAFAIIGATFHNSIQTIFTNGIQASVIQPVDNLGPMTIGSPTTTSIMLQTDGGLISMDGTFIPSLPATETIVATATITANACGTIKRITAAGAVTTNTTNTITAPSSANAGCRMVINNVGANTITLDKNANILLVGGADVALLANSSITVYSDGSIWRQITAQLTAT
jgi:hypothetical protein